MQCINTKHPEYIDLENNSSIHPDALKAMISIWMDNNTNEDRYPTLDELGIPQKELFKAITEVKPGVEELFESNPELANDVYEALGFEQNGIKQTFKNSLWRGQEQQPYINENGDLVLTPTYDTLFKSEGISFAENLNMAQSYGERYSKNPFIVEINQDYANTIYPLDIKGRSQDYGKRVIGDEGEQRFVSKENIIILKGKFKVHKKQLNYDFSETSILNLVDEWAKQFIETDIAEFNRYGESSQGYATEEEQYYISVKDELKNRGVTEKELLFLKPANPIEGEEIIKDALNIENVTQEDIDIFLKKQKELQKKYYNETLDVKDSFGFKKLNIKINDNQITSQQKQQAQQRFQEYVNATGKQDIEGFEEFVNKEDENTSQEKEEVKTENSRVLSLSKANEVLEGSYPAEISERRIGIIKGRISKINNELAKNGIKRTYKIENVKRVKGKEAFTWKLLEIDEFLNVEEKIARTYNPDLNRLNSAKADDLKNLTRQVDLFTNKPEEVVEKKDRYVFIDMQTHDYETYKNYIYLNDTPIGTMILSNDGTYFNVEKVNIKGAYQRQGIGTAVYKYMGDWAEKNGLRLRSHIERHESSEGMWKKLAKEGLATLYDERYYFGEQNKVDESGQLDLFYRNNQDDIDSMKIIINC